MTSRLLGRCARLFSKGSPQAAAGAARLPVPVAGPAEPLWAQAWPRASVRPLCEAGFAQLQTARFSPVPKCTELDLLVETAATLEEVLVAWEKHGGNANQAAIALIKVTRLFQGVKDKSETCHANLLMDGRLRDMLDTIVGQVSVVWNGTLVTVMRALWTLGLPSNSPALSSVQTEVLWRMRRLSYKQLAFLVDWGSGLKGQQDVTIVNSALKQLELRWTEISDTKTVSTLIFKGEHLSPTLMDRLEDKALELAEGFSAEDIGRLCVSMAYQRRRSVPLLRALSYHLLQKPSADLTTPLLLDMAYAYGKLNFHNFLALQRMASELLPRVPELSPVDVTRCAKSLGFLKWLHLPLFEAFTEHYLANSQRYSIHQLSNLVMTLARLGYQVNKGEEFYTKVHAALQDSLSDLEPFLQTDVVWSLCVLQQAKLHHLTALTQPAHMTRLSDAADGNEPRLDNYLLKLLHIHATLQLEHAGSSSSAPPPSALTSRLAGAHKAALSPMRSSLRETLQRLVEDNTASLRIGVDTVYGWTMDGELVVDNENQPLDLLALTAPHLPVGGGGDQPLPAGARRLAFLAWEYPHFCSKSKDLLGRFAMMRRHLQLAGFITVEVPYHEWLERKSDRQRMACLKDKMGKAVAEDMAK